MLNRNIIHLVLLCNFGKPVSAIRLELKKNCVKLKQEYLSNTKSIESFFPLQTLSPLSSQGWLTIPALDVSSATSTVYPPWFLINSISPLFPSRDTVTYSCSVEK